MAFELAIKGPFLKDLAALPQGVQKRINRDLSAVQRDPFRSRNVKRIFKQHYKNVYRLRVGDYRIVYAVGQKVVNLLAAGHRRDIYERHLAGGEVAVSLLDVEEALPQPIYYPPTPFDPELASYPEGGPQVEDFEPAAAGRGILADLLKLWGIPPAERDYILSCDNLADLFALDLPAETLKTILHWRRPPSLTELMEEPDLKLPSVDDLDAFLDGTLTQFLLKLSPEQERAAQRSLKGPTLVKGGPGTGKSLVALYRIRNLLKPAAAQLFAPVPRILFVTYGRSLMAASRQLLEELIPKDLNKVTITNVDSLVRRIVLAAGFEFSPVSDWQEYVKRAKEEVLLESEKEAAAAWFSLLELSTSYLMEEIQWVIEGRRLRSLDQYLQADRIGREVPFGEGLRRLVWAVYEKTQDFLGENGRSWEYYRGLALDILQEKGIAVKKYDVVIVDEAQDLSPAALALCAELCACPQGLFFTADANQSIYNRGFAWSRVHNALNFRGRSTILRCNYRSTRQIAQACFDCLAADGTDRETIEAKAVRTGPRPQLHRCNSTQEQYQSIARFLEESAAQLRLPVWTGTVLTPANRLAGDIAEALRAWAIPAKHVSGDELHLKERVVKVMTIHAAKGLEFPTVALAHLEERYFPGLPEGLKSEAEMREFTAGRQKLLFVGCSRAMRRLALFGNEAYFSPLAERLDPGLWELRGI